MSAFRDQGVLITGSSSGIGRALALELARQGAHVALAARRADRLEALAGELRATGRQALALPCDVTKRDDLERAAAATRAAFGQIDVVVANAGFGVAGKLSELTLEDYRRQFETNVFGVLGTVYATLPDLRQSRGCLVLMGSVAGHVALSGISAYAMSKFAVRALGQALRYELAPEGISVVLISPGMVESEFRQVDNRGVWHPEARDKVPGWLRMPTEQAARKMVRAIARRRREQVLTRLGKVAVAAQRHVPWLIDQVARLGVRGRTPTGGWRI